MLNWVIFWN